MSMNHSARLLCAALTAAVLSVSLAANASALAYGVGTVTGDSLRLRESAGTDSAILTTAVKGTNVVVLENQVNGWYKVNLAGIEGYMSADYLSVSVQTGADLGTGTLNTGGSPLYLRAGPGTEYNTLTSIPASAILTITGSENGWYKTSYDGAEGYVYSDCVVLSDAQNVAEPGRSTGILNTGGTSLNLRAGPGTDYDRLASIPTNTVLTITGSENGWYKTSYNGMEGYVSSDYVLISDGTLPANADLGAQIVAYAQQFLGCSYVYGASGPNSFDCSGFTSYVYKSFGYTLNRTAAGQYSNGLPIDESQMQPGDLLLWRAYDSSKTATHAGIYIGNHQYIHASSTGGRIQIDDMDSAISTRYLVGVRRIVS